MPIEELMTTSLHDLVRRARAVRKVMAFQNSSYVQLLASLGQSEIEEHERNGTLSRSTRSLLEGRCLLPRWAVDGLIDRFLRMDVEDCSREWEIDFQFYARSDLSEAEFREYLEQQSRAGLELYLVLWNSICSWQSSQLFLIPMLIEDDEFFHSLKGYLISVNRAYMTYLDLLFAAYAEKWPNWSGLCDDDWRDGHSDEEVE